MMKAHEYAALLSGELAIHQSIFTLFPNDNASDTHYGAAAAILGQAIDEVDEFESTGDEPNEVIDLITAASAWRADGKLDDETFTEALDAMEALSKVARMPKMG